MSKITNIASVQELEHQVKSFEYLLKNKNKLKKIGITPIQMIKMKKQLKDIKEELVSVKNTLEKFDDFFSDRGWCGYESFNLTVMEKIVSLAENENINLAEQELLAYYREKVTMNTRTLIKNPTFKIRNPIFQVALDHHISKDYTSSVPLFLMLMDGFVNDIEPTGLFAKQTNLTAWDSIAAHENGISKIIKELNRSRKKTTSESIDFPYRNGILHGRDLNYANEKVSAKALHLLIALGDWAEAKSKMNTGKSQKQYVPPTFEESLAAISESLLQHQHNHEVNEQIVKWKKRNITIGTDIPASGVATLYEPNSPERSIVDFFEYINRSNYGNIAKIIHIEPENFSIKIVAGKMKESLKNIKIKEFKLLKIIDKAPAITEIEVETTFIIKEKIEHLSIERFRWIFVDETGKPLPRNMSGKWSLIDSFTNIWSSYEYKAISMI